MSSKIAVCIGQSGKLCLCRVHGSSKMMTTMEATKEVELL
uniref:Uncharacterized protein n=1 Tax=Arundo donax TaxID=35708 RepID=A0A0A9F5I2_ARUDO